MQEMPAMMFSELKNLIINGSSIAIIKRIVRDGLPH